MKPLDPIKLRAIEEDARNLANLLDHLLNPEKEAGKTEKGFALIIFSFDGQETTWVSNAQRAEMIKAMEELMARWKSGKRSEALERHVKDEAHKFTGKDLLGSTT